MLARHGNKVAAMNHLDSELEDEEEELGMEEFRFHELLQRPVQIQTIFYDLYLQMIFTAIPKCIKRKRCFSHFWSSW